MTEHEMRDLDAWIAEHVMMWKRIKKPARIVAGTFCYSIRGQVITHYSGLQLCFFNPTTDPASAMQVLDKCADKTEDGPCIYLGKVGTNWIVGWNDGCGIHVESNTCSLPIAICLFAKGLFK